MTYLELVQRARAAWETGEHGPYICDHLDLVVEEASAAEYLSALRQSSQLKREVFDLLRGAFCVGQFLFPTRLHTSDLHLTKGEQEAARDFRESTLWPQLITAAKILDKNEGESAND